MALRDGEVKRTTLTLVVNRGRLLMIFKKRGQGAGKWNMPGGKLCAGEMALAAAVRETEEETGLTPLQPREIGQLEFYFPESQSWDNTCTVFLAENFRGELIAETDECTAEWVPLDRIPYGDMWNNDRLWLPVALAGKPFHRIYTFDSADRMKDEKIVH